MLLTVQKETAQPLLSATTGAGRFCPCRTEVLKIEQGDLANQGDILIICPCFERLKFSCEFSLVIPRQITGFDVVEVVLYSHPDSLLF
jgi:hypothetical protein